MASNAVFNRTDAYVPRPRSLSQRERRPCVDVQELQNLRTDTNPAVAEN
ncbi:hypothetical protein C7458_101181 [Williamsia muralis]|nr:hypothetical protein C7458_101181 [Williamsia marianensis]